MDLETILILRSIDFTPFEIRGAKAGINNARSTGPVFANGNYIPYSSAVSGDGTFNTSDSTVTNLYVSGGYNTGILRPGDALVSNSKLFYVKKVLNSDSFTIGLQKDGTADSTAGFSGGYPINFSLDQRNYIVEPDVDTNTLTGTANFTKNSFYVTGTGLNVIPAGGFIKHDGFQQFYRIDSSSPTALHLTSPYIGDTTTGPYTAKKWIIGQTDIRYATDNVQYDNQAAKWSYSAIKASDVTTSTDYAPLADGINLAFTRALDKNAPDIMDIATVSYKTFARQTQYETFQFSLPVVPNPEVTVELYVNDIKKDRYPLGNQDYVLQYSQSPIYELPLPPTRRTVANVMFLEGIANVTPSISLTESGQIHVTDSSGVDISGILSGSEQILLDGTTQLINRDYLLEPNSGTIEIADTTQNEPIVKYVGMNFNNIIDYGFYVYLNSVKQKISFPSEPDDDILFQPATGRFKPQKQDHPGPNETYEFHYMVEAQMITDEVPTILSPTVIVTKVYPIKQDSVNLTKNDNILTEFEDFFVSHLTGRITLAESLAPKDNLIVDYSPLSKQIDNLTYDNNKWYCRAHDVRLVIKNAENFEFALVDPSIDLSTIIILRLYNETKDKEYVLSGMQIVGNKTIKLAPGPNASIGLNSSDVVLIDYKFESETLQYSPIEINYLNIKEGSKAIYMEGVDLTPSIVPNAILGLTYPDAATQFYFTISSAFYDGYGTRINLITALPDDIVNPKIYITDEAVQFNTVPLTADPVITGTISISFSGTNIRNLFRSGTLVKVNDDLYPVSSATYDNQIEKTVVIFNAEAIHDCTSSSDLMNLKYSDCPIYNEGDTEITPFRPAITIMQQPTLIINGLSSNVYDGIVSSDRLMLDGTNFLFSDSSTLNDMSSALGQAFQDITVTTYVPGWLTNKLSPVTAFSIYENSNTVLYAKDTLWYHDSDSTVFTDTTNYALSDSGTVVLTNPLVRKDRYNLDYLGRQFLGDTQVEYTLRYFTSLPPKSKVTASFQYDNLDQFYIQVLDRRTFFETVSIPRMQEEAIQLNDNVGQGGEVPGDTADSNSEGGLAGTEFRRQDAAIECRVFKSVYDFFSNRLKAFGDEMSAGLGWVLFNNDGMFTDAQQDAAFKVVNRIYPTSDYTNLEPMKVNPITGYFINSGAYFTNGSPVVLNIGDSTFWNEQLVPGDFIGRFDSTKRYQIASISPEGTDATLTSSFIETTTPDSEDGDVYTASNKFPLYDDDGHLGAKILGSKYKKFRLKNGDLFDCYVDDVYKSYTFTTPTDPFMALMYPLFRLSAESVSQLLTSSIPEIECTQENILDPSKSYGYKSSLVLRTAHPYNKLALGYGSAVKKLGFLPGAIAYGNLDRTSHNPELIWDINELSYLGPEIADTSALYNAGLTNKLTRIDPVNLPYAGDMTTQILGEINCINYEAPRVLIEISATGVIIQEPTLPAYAQTLVAYNNAVDFYYRPTIGVQDEQAHNLYVTTNWQDKTTDWKWIIDFTEHSQYIRGKNSSGIAVDTTSGAGITPILGDSTFILESPSDNDRHILNALMPDATFYTPDLVYLNNSQPVPGTWTGWDTSAYPYPDSSYSINNQLLFTLDSPPIMYIQKDYSFTTPTVITTSPSIAFNWNDSAGPQTISLNYASYVTLGSLVAAINSLDGFGAYAVQDPNYTYGNLDAILSPLTSYPGLTLNSGSLAPAFSMISSDATNPYYEIDSSAIAIIRQVGFSYYKNELLYVSYPTLGSLESGLNSITNLSTTTIFDSTYVYGQLQPDVGYISGTTYVRLQPVPLFNVYFEQNNIRYSTDSTSVNIFWEEWVDTIHKQYLYTGYPLVTNMKTVIGSLIGIDTTGNNIYNSEYCEAFKFNSGFLDATLYRGLRDCSVEYQTISDRLLVERMQHNEPRYNFDSSRISYLYVREPQIRDHVRDEQILRTTDGLPSDLYTWANNRFNRRQGCYARLKQIEQQIATNNSALDINRSFI